MIKNPTTKQLRTLTGIIYLIRNKINKKIYIGQSIRTFGKRYNSRKWWKRIGSQYLSDSIKKYGHDNFEIEILRYGIIDIEELNTLEDFYAIKYNSYAPNGYNLTKCGKNRCEKRNEEEYKFKNIFTGETFSVNNLSKFCREHNVDGASLHMAATTTFPFYFTLEGYTHINAQHYDYNNRTFYRKHSGIKPPFILYKNNKQFIFHDMKEFLSIHKINSKHGLTRLLKVIKGQKRQYLGFTLNKDTALKHGQSKYYNIKLCNKTGEILLFKNSKDFTDRTGKAPEQILRLITGTRRTANGFKLVSYEEY